MFRYAALRLGLLVVVAALLYIAGMRGLLLIGTTFIVAALVSYVVFGKERDRVVARMEAFRNREGQTRNPDEDMLVEDAAVDEALPAEQSSPDQPSSNQSRPEQSDPDSKLD